MSSPVASSRSAPHEDTEAASLNEVMRTMVDLSPVGQVVVDAESLAFVHFNPAACSTLGYTADEFRLRTLVDLTLDCSAAEVRATLAAMDTDGEGSIDRPMRARDGSVRHMRIRSNAVQVQDRRCRLLVWQDITEQRAVQDALAARAHTMQSMLDHAPDAIIRYDRALHRTYANPAVEQVLGVRPSDILGRDLSQYNAAELPSVYEANLRAVFARGQADTFEMRFSKPGCTVVRTSHIRLAPEYGPDGSVETALAVIRDITDLVTAREELRLLANTDALTALPNRPGLRERLRSCLEHGGDERRPLAVMLIDLDRFKDVNDSLGHAAGDTLLREVARRLCACVDQPGDVVARLGGDEFVVVLPRVREAIDATVVAQRMLEALRRPMVLGMREVGIGASIGIAVAPQDGRSADELLARADAAMYATKRRGRDGFGFYTRGMTEEAELRLTLGTDLRQAVARDELRLLYQPKVSLDDGRTVGFEALLRWQHPRLGLLPPDRFIGLAEDTRVIAEIGAWVIHEAARFAVECHRHTDAPVHVALNLSPRQFQDGDLVATLRHALTRTGCRGEWLELEITERLILHADRRVQDTLRDIAALGIRTALDDFGSGHSSLAYLHQFQLQVLKIDRSFVRGAGEEPRRLALLRAFIGVAHALGLTPVAEGVETAEDAQTLRSEGCVLAQGWYYGRPMEGSAALRQMT